MCGLGRAAPVRRAINVQLARVARGQPRLLQAARTGRSAARPGVAAPFPKLIVRTLVSLDHHQPGPDQAVPVGPNEPVRTTYSRAPR